MSDPISRQLARALTSATRNNSGGPAFGIDDWTAYRRFLIMGTSGGTYYVGEQKLTAEHLALCSALLSRDPLRFVAEAAEVLKTGRAPKRNYALYALALASGYAQEEAVSIPRSYATADTARRAFVTSVRSQAASAVAATCQIPTDLFLFLSYVDQLKTRGWGPTLKQAFLPYYLKTPVDRLAYHAIKYSQRHGYRHRDLLRLLKPKTFDPNRSAVFGYMVGKIPGLDVRLPMVIRGAASLDAVLEWEAAILIDELDLPWECVPERWAKSQAVQQALLRRMPVGATLRQLARYTRAGYLTEGSDQARMIVDRLTDGNRVRSSRVHPMAVLDAWCSYASGGRRGQSRARQYDPIREVGDAVVACFEESLGNVEPTGRRIYVGLDWSGSMNTMVSGSVATTCVEAATALAYVIAKTERYAYVAAFGSIPGRIWSPMSAMVTVPAGDFSTVGDMVRQARGFHFGGTNCAAPIQDAEASGRDVDAFVILTDNETNEGTEPPFKALERYRRKVGHRVKLVVVSMTASKFSIANPADADMLDVIGFDPSTPAVISNFIAS